MSNFSDLFVIQIIGQLLDKKFKGTVNFNLEGVPARLQLSEGKVAHIAYESLPSRDALQAIIWRQQGKIELQEQKGNVGDGYLDYGAMIEEILATDCPSMPDTCPMMNRAYLQRTNLKPAQQSQFLELGFNILLHIKSGAGIEEASKNIPTQDFWRGVFHLAGNGQIVTGYTETLGKFLQHLEKNLAATLSKFLGPHIARTHAEKTTEILGMDWPAWNREEPADLIYGSAPYKSWAKSLENALQQIGAPSFTKRSYQHVISKLKPDEANLLKQLTD